ncbi:hypothetical protein [Sulfurimonas sp.]|uniref:hypothetical protein n=1 Tax=Sulfurimonas sp. TaxID=2022749 RepID=UPI0026351DA5|nr:hypothetical protein [Sulfurimonas sp.]MDD5157548.1 hypothetical protein [Sulfurimonas sp.]
MKFILLLLICIVALFAKNPAVYASLGDELYDSVEMIEKLKENIEFSNNQDIVDNYVDEVKKSKNIGFAVEAGDKSVNKVLYLAKLRELSKIYSSFNVKNKIEGSFEKSIEDKNSKLFIAVVNSGVINNEIYKSEILAYYKQHMDEIDPTGVIKEYLDKEEVAKGEQERVEIERKGQTKDRRSTSKHDYKQDRIRQIREDDKRKEQRMEKLLNDDVKQKKEAIRQVQKNELNQNP